MNPGLPDVNHVDQSEDLRWFAVWVHRLLLAALVFMVLAIGVERSGIQWARVLPLAFLAVMILVGHWQLRQSPRRAIISVGLGLWVMTAGNALQYAGVHSVGMVIFSFIIGLAGWLVGRRWLMIMTLATVGFVLILGLAETQGAFHPTQRAPTWIVALEIAVILLVTAALTYLAPQSLIRSRDTVLQLSNDLAQQNAQIAQRERELQLLLTNVPAAVASFDAQSRLRYCNIQYAALFGAEPMAIVGKSIMEYVPRETLDQMLPYWERALEGVPQSYHRTSVDPRTRAISWVDARVIPEFENGKVVGLYGLLVDVTEKVKAETEIRELNADLESRVARRTAELAQAMDKLHDSREELVRSQARATLSALVASVSHELSTPIGNSVLVASTLSDLSRQLQQQLDSGQVRKSTLMDLTRTVGEGGQLLQRNLARAETLLKNFKQVSVDQASEQRREFDLAYVVAEVVASLGPSLKNSPHRVVQQIPPGIMMDSMPGPLGQVVINLINNAYMHAFEGRTDGVLTISATTQDRQVQLHISDNGTGMEQSVLLHLFEPFFSTKIGHGGTGLGMSIVDSIVRKVLGGAVHVRSVVGNGTTFDIHLPRVAPIES